MQKMFYKTKRAKLRKAALLITAALTVFTMNLTSSAVEASRLSKYDFELYMKPVWEAGTVYQETAVFYVNGDGKTENVTLLFRPETVVSVRSYGLDTVYSEGKDYVVTETGLALAEGSGIPVMPRSAYCDENDREFSLQLKDGSGGALKTDNSVMPAYYLAVTYTTADTWSGPVPESEPDRLTGVSRKLANKEPLTVSIIGDSISVGYSASGLNEKTYRVDGTQTTAKIGISPFMPTWPNQLIEALKRTYGYDDITLTNWAIGGTSTSYGPIDDMIDRVIGSDPDLIIIGFGMNEYWSPAAGHRERIGNMLERFHDALPDAEFILLSGMLPNMMAYDESNVHLDEFEESYHSLQNGSAGLEIAVAPLNSVYRYVREKTGDFALIGGNRNHPNDFAARLYAQTVAAVLGVYDVPWRISGETDAGYDSETGAIPGAETPGKNLSVPLVGALAATAVGATAVVSAVIVHKSKKK